jgi:glyoxylase-like metal-dependent hydrolase (beta-lactamase superfamily II)
VLNHRLVADRDDVDDIPSHVVPIALPLPLKDLRVVNVYAILGQDGVTLVDSGWTDEPRESAILAALHRLGFTPSDVRRILVTHAHWDHFSRAIHWQRRYGTSVLIGREEHHTIEVFD